MAGLKIDDAFPRVISAKTHGVIDYIHAGTNILVGALFSRRNGRAGAAAYALGGGAESKTVASEVLGVRIDYFISLDFAGFKQIVDTLGGVEINVDAGEGEGE